MTSLVMADLGEALGFLLSMAQQYVFRDFQTYFEALDLTPHLYSVLILIESNPGCRQTDIGSTLGVLQTNLVERIDMLVSRGLVQRVEHESDRRAKALTLTPAGREFMKKVRQTHEEMTGALARTFGENDHAQLVALLQKLIVCEQGRTLP
jgi:DNA-binding MarR family transcriptional regulator